MDQLYFKYLRLVLVFCFAGITFGSCKSNYMLLNIETARPGKEQLTDDIQSITLMNRSMNNQFSNYNEDSLQLYFYRKGFQLSKIALDSLACDTTLLALSALMPESGRYQIVVPVDRNLKREMQKIGTIGILDPVVRPLPGELSYEQIPDTLNPFIVKDICRAYNTDALMVMEKFSTKVMTDYSHEKSGMNDYHYASIDLKYNAHFRIYKPGSKNLVKEIELTDTIYWESSDYTLERLFKKLPTIKQALINAGIKIALDVDEKLSPTWIKEKRGYFLFSSKDDQGQKLMNERNYTEAEKFWNGLASSTDKKIRSKAEYNLALISELNGDLEAAIKWGVKSFQSLYRHQTEAYLDILKDKIELNRTKH